MGDGTYTESEIGLPPLFTLRGFEGSFAEYIERLHWQYRAMVDHAGISLWGKPLTVSCVNSDDGRDRLFWHLITTGTSAHTEATRRLSLKRCAHLPWVWDILERLARDDLRVCWWRERSALLVATVDFRMVVVLYETDGTFRLATAIPVRKRSTRNWYFRRAARAWDSDNCRHHVIAEWHPKWRGCTGERRSLAAVDRVRCWM